MQTIAAVFLGKIISQISKTFKIGGGSAAPGLYALKIDPNLVEKLSEKIPRNVCLTGTNGKTTTARMLAHFAEQEGLKVIRNHTGSNLERGVASALISNYQLPTTNYQPNLGIWELDEAAFNSVAPKLKPDILVFLNVFRDQLDRYGEVDSVIKGWSSTLKSLKTQTVVLVNGDDTNTAKLKSSFKGKVYQFGVKDYKIVGESIEHLKEQENLDYEAKNVKLNGLKGSSFLLQTTNLPFGGPLPTTLYLPGIYHIYDFLAAFAAGISLGFKPDKMIASLKNFSPAFGRMERISLNPRFHRTPTSEVGMKRHVGFPQIGYIFLIKNPAGATQVFQTIAPQLKPEDRLLLALNDNLADGTDVSWIWDANFEKLLSPSLRAPKGRGNLIYVSGIRSYDLANRLKYAGFDPKNITVEPGLQNALKQARKGLKGHLFILPTYTAMLELQGILTKAGLKKHYWEDI